CPNAAGLPFPPHSISALVQGLSLHTREGLATDAHEDLWLTAESLAEPPITADHFQILAPAWPMSRSSFDANGTNATMRSGVWRGRPQDGREINCSVQLQSYPGSAIARTTRQGDVEPRRGWCSPQSRGHGSPLKLVPCARQSVRLLVAVITTRATFISRVLDMAETERSVALSGCKMDKVDKMRMQSRGWACADAADSSRPSRRRAVLETSSANKAQGPDACSMHGVDERHDSGNPACPMRPRPARLVSILPVITSPISIPAAVLSSLSQAIQDCRPVARTSNATPEATRTLIRANLPQEADGLVHETSKVLCLATRGASASTSESSSSMVALEVMRCCEMCHQGVLISMYCIEHAALSRTRENDNFKAYSYHPPPPQLPACSQKLAPSN
ncbi:hypothetical protein CCMA1212_009589, partial [Trichoderma ghanense]